jgi:RNA polymerase sigma-70 factor (ECF subfamily)
MLVTASPETRESLLLRLRDADDAAAWDEFVTIYRPMVHRLGLRKGLQDCDADDLSQRVMMSVSRAIAAWEKNESRGGFRAWLRTVARNAIINMLQRGPKDDALGGSEFLDVCNAVPSRTDEVDQLIEEEHARSLLRAAAERVKEEVQPTTWRAFWRTTIEGETPQQVADKLEIPIGKVYGARSRVMKLLQRAAGDLNE